MMQEIAGLIALSVFAFYAIKLLNSFRNGVIAKSWRQVAVGTFFLIMAQFPVFIASSGAGEVQEVVLNSLAAAMRLLGVIFLIVGLRAQARLWSGQVRVGSELVAYEEGEEEQQKTASPLI
jgi:hypothetical protein